jgi:hypothetical protein
MIMVMIGSETGFWRYIEYDILLPGADFPL